MSDDLKASALSVYGNTFCKTPNIDRLAGSMWLSMCNSSGSERVTKSLKQNVDERLCLIVIPMEFI
jgi:hypothetical protein